MMSFNQRTDYQHQYPIQDQDHVEKIANTPRLVHSESTNSLAAAGSQREEELFRLLNSSKPHPPKSAIPIPPPGTNITDEDLAFLKAASEVVKIHENQIDPTIRDILNRLQYSNSPHGGLPISRQYLQRIDHNTSSSNLSTLHSNYTYKNEEDLTLAKTTAPNVLLQQQQQQQHQQQHQHPQQSQNNGFQNFGNSPSNFVVPPFTENPLRNPPSSLDFPQFSLDIFKTTDEMSFSQLCTPSNQDDADNEGDIDDDSEDSQSEDEEMENEDGKRRGGTNLPTLNRNGSDEVRRNFKCSDCSISFKRSSDLKRHEKIHLKTPPNVCPQCHKGFARRDALKRHVGTMTCKRNRERLLEQMKEHK